MRKKINITLLLIIILGIALRFYNLNWGSPFYFHPDERNIAGSISRMFWEKTYNPNFFAYGSFWSYIVLFIIKLIDPLYAMPNPQIVGFIETVLPKDPFSRAIIILRVFSALQGIGTIIIGYFVGKILIKKLEIPASKQGGRNSKFETLLLPFLIATSPGFIQASHFGTSEGSLTFLYFLVFYFCLKALNDKNHPLRCFFLALVFFGISISIKVTSLVLFPVLFFQFLFINKKSFISFKSLLFLIILLFVPAVIFLISNPFSFSFQQFSNITIQQLLHPFSTDFLSTMNYERGVAEGTMKVFYTQQFQNTLPIIYQFVRILPYVLNPLIFLLFILSLSFFPFKFLSAAGRSKSVKIKMLDLPLILTITFFMIIFLPNSILYVKWTRYIIPALPYVYIFVFMTLLRVSQRYLILLVFIVSLLFAGFFTSVYSSDTRIEAAAWAKDNLKPDSRIISEIYDMGIVPFNDVFNYSQIRLFNFYDFDDKINDEVELADLKQSALDANVIILPSGRISATRLRLKIKYPNGFWFYDSLFNGKLGYRLAADFSHPYDKIIPGLAPDESFTVFDHPQVEIFMK